MSQYSQNYPSIPVSELGVEQRSTFILRTYAHLIGAVALFTGIEVFIFTKGYDLAIAKALTSVSWLVVLGGFMVASWLATRLAARAQSKAAQYAGLIGYVFVQAIIFVPLLYVAERVAKGGVIASAAGVTLAGFALLTGIVFVTRKDFSFLRIFLTWTAILALVAIVVATIFGLTLGFWFSLGMVVFAGAIILHDTSNVLHYYPEDRYVSASLQLFAGVALMFWYVLQLFISRR